MNRALTVARWEYVEKVRSKAFLISLLLTPTIMVAVAVLPGILADRADTETQVIGVIDPSGEIAAPLADLLAERYRLPDGRRNYLVRPLDGAADSARREGDRLVIARSIEGYVVTGAPPPADTVVEYHSLNVGNIKLIDRIRSGVKDIIVRKKLAAHGLDPAFARDLTSPISMKTIKLSKSGQAEEAGFERVFFTSYAFMMMMFFLLITSGQMLVRSMLEEKSNRVVELLVSSCTAGELMAGKIVGLSLLGLTQMGLWAIIGIGVSVSFGVILLPLGHALLLFAYFILGYTLFAAIFVAAGAPVSTEQEAQQINSYLVMILMVPIVMAFTVIQNPDSTLVRILSFIPLLTPSMMALRIPIQLPSATEIAGTLAVLLVSGIVAIRIAGRIFRVTILLTGKRPHLGEIVDLIRG